MINLQDQAMPGWEDKDDLDLTAEDLGEMLAAGTPVTVITPQRKTFALEWVPSVMTFSKHEAMTFAARGSAYTKEIRVNAGPPSPPSTSVAGSLASRA